MDTLIGIFESRAATAWRDLRPELGEPERIEILKGRKERKMVFRLVGAGPSRTDVIAKRYRLTTGLVERAIYDVVLPRLPVPSLRSHGFVEEADGTRCWLFLEDAGGEPYSVSVEDHRRLAGRWLGLLHTSAPQAPAAGLPDRGPGHYLECLRTARARIAAHRENATASPHRSAVLGAMLLWLDALEARWDAVERFCDAMPRTVVHGDFVPKNLRVRPGEAGLALLCFDWGCAGWGHPAADLAQRPASSDRFSASPDLAAYWSVVREHWPEYGLAMVSQWANLGGVFRSLASISWASRSLASTSVDKHIAEMLVGQAAIARALRAAAWVD